MNLPFPPTRHRAVLIQTPLPHTHRPQPQRGGGGLNKLSADLLDRATDQKSSPASAARLRPQTVHSETSENFFKCQIPLSPNTHNLPIERTKNLVIHAGKTPAFYSPPGPPTNPIFPFPVLLRRCLSSARLFSDAVLPRSRSMGGGAERWGYER